jgi:hypothetical protein
VQAIVLDVKGVLPSQPYSLNTYNLQTKVTVPVAKNNLDDAYPAWKPGL